MSRFQDFSVTKSEIYEFHKFTTLIWKDCQPYLKDLLKIPRGNYLYSGRDTKGGLIKRTMRKDRRPTDTHPDIHKDFGKEFIKQFGWDARANSMFCSGTLSDTETYGTGYIIFPIGSYKVIYNDDIGDLYILLARTISDGSPGSRKSNPLLKHFASEAGGGVGVYMAGIDNEFSLYYEEVTMEGGDHGFYTYNSNEELFEVPSHYKTEEAAGKYVKSVMLDDEEYDRFHLVWHPEMEYNQFYRQFFSSWVNDREQKNLESAKVRYNEWIRDTVSGYSTNDLKGSIMSGNEVMVNCKTYYGLHAKTHEYNLDDYTKEFGIKGHKTEEELAVWWRDTMKKR